MIELIQLKVLSPLSFQQYVCYFLCAIECLIMRNFLNLQRVKELLEDLLLFIYHLSLHFKFLIFFGLQNISELFCLLKKHFIYHYRYFMIWFQLLNFSSFFNLKLKFLRYYFPLKDIFTSTPFNQYWYFSFRCFHLSFNFPYHFVQIFSWDTETHVILLFKTAIYWSKQLHWPTQVHTKMRHFGKTDIFFYSILYYFLWRCLKLYSLNYITFEDIMGIEGNGFQKFAAISISNRCYSTKRKGKDQ